MNESNIKFVVKSYESATRPMYASRSAEYKAVAGYAKHYHVNLTEEEFDWAVAIKFGDGLDYEWAED